MKILFAVLLIVHGLIHLMGTAKAFGVADLPQLTQQNRQASGRKALKFLRGSTIARFAQGLGRAVATPLLTEADSTQLPALVQR